ncbi:MAG TPA: C4-type zinc ribbon domain-containing protein [Candidatus Omnitrophota bacterium]|nr:C4-type zinc ribbon domain-containing protein [Candidatus Omnitrophota bacterium]
MTNPITQNLDLLKRAQQLDSEIYHTRLLLEEIPVERAKLSLELENEKARSNDLDKILKDIQLKLKTKELELSQKEGQVKKLDGQLSQVKTNKEYNALQQEIASLKADNSLLEEEIIRVLDEVEAAKDEARKEKEKFTLVAKSFQGKDDEQVSQEKNLQGRLIDLKKQRDEAVMQLPPELGELYNRIASKKQGLALALVTGDVCTACQMQLRPQLINEVRLGENIVVCENCSRILYFDS